MGHSIFFRTSRLNPVYIVINMNWKMHGNSHSKDGFRGNDLSILWMLAPPGYFFVCFFVDCFKAWVFWEGHKIWKKDSLYFWQEHCALCAQQRTCQKVYKYFSKQMWTSCIIQTLSQSSYFIILFLDKKSSKSFVKIASDYE